MATKTIQLIPIFCTPDMDQHVSRSCLARVASLRIAAVAVGGRRLCRSVRCQERGLLLMVIVHCSSGACLSAMSHLRFCRATLSRDKIAGVTWHLTPSRKKCLGQGRVQTSRVLAQTFSFRLAKRFKRMSSFNCRRPRIPHAMHAVHSTYMAYRDGGRYRRYVLHERFG